MENKSIIPKKLNTYACLLLEVQRRRAYSIVNKIVMIQSIILNNDSQRVLISCTLSNMRIVILAKIRMSKTISNPLPAGVSTPNII